MILVGAFKNEGKHQEDGGSLASPNPPEVTKSESTCSMGILSVVDRDVVAGLWPEDRVVAGLRVCKELRAILEKGASSVKLRLRRRWKGFSALSSLDVCKDLVRLEGFAGAIDSATRGEGVSVHIEATECAVAQGASAGTVAQTLTSGMALASQMGRCKSVVSVKLARNGLCDADVSAVVRAVGRMEQLHTLDLRGNKIGKGGCGMIAAVLERCKALKTLSLRDNELGEAGAARIACALGRCWWLENLDLGLNKIRDGGASFLTEGLRACSVLTRLDLSGNGIGFEGDGAEDFAEALGGLGRLTSLDLSDNAIKAGGAEALGEALGGEGGGDGLRLRALELGGNSLGPVGWLAAARELWARGPRFERIDLRGNGIREEGATVLAGVLAECRALRHLGLEGNRVGPQGLEAMGAALAGCLRLESLLLSGNALGNAGVQVLAGLLACGQEGEGGGFGQCLRVLDLGQNGVEAEGVRALAGLVGGLRGLVLSSNPIKGAGLSEVARLVQSAGGLERLQVSHAAGGQEGGGWLGQCLCKGLRVLDVGNNALGVEGVTRLATALSTAPFVQLTRLSLRHNSLRGRGCAALAGALAGGACSSVRELDMGYNGLGAEGAGWVAAGLKGCGSLETLGLAHNSVGDEGVRLLADGLRLCSRLVRLNLSRNKIRDVGAEVLAGLVANGSCEAWEVLDLSKNHIQREGAGKLELARQKSGAVLLVDVSKNKV